MKTLHNTAFPVLSDVLFQDEPMLSRESVMVKGGTGGNVRQLLLGTVLGIVFGAATVSAAVAVGTNTGNGVFGAVTADADAPEGEYNILFLEPNADAGDFAVFLPSGILDGHGKVAVAYNGKINFTIADGVTDFKAGDAFTVKVSRAVGVVVAWDPEASDGSQYAAGVLISNTTAPDGEDAEGLAVVRKAVLRADGLIWPEGVADAAKAAAIKALADKMIVLR